MNSIRFPKLFKGNSTVVEKDKESTLQNFKLLLMCEKGEFEGDPSFGVGIRRHIYDQNGYLLYDILVDEIYSAIKIFLPQVTVNRDDITLVQKQEKLYAKIRCINKVDFTTNTLELAIFIEEER